MEVIHYERRDEKATAELDREALAVLDDEELIERIAGAAWQEEILAGGGEILLLRELMTVIGMCSYIPVSKTDVELRKFRIRADRQGSGCGALLLDHVERRAWERGYSRIVLETSALREKTLKFYEKKGYTRLGERHEGDLSLVDFEKTLR